MFSLWYLGQPFKPVSALLLPSGCSQVPPGLWSGLGVVGLNEALQGMFGQPCSVAARQLCCTFHPLEEAIINQTGASQPLEMTGKHISADTHPHCTPFVWFAVFSYVHVYVFAVLLPSLTDAAEYSMSQTYFCLDTKACLKKRILFSKNLLKCQ